MEISKWCSEAGCLCRDLSLSCSEKGEIMCRNDEVVFGNGGNRIRKRGNSVGNGGNGVGK